MSILESKTTQLSLADDGQIFWQSEISNPLPGEPVAAVKKGNNILQPVAQLLEAECLKDLDAKAVETFTQEWLKAHIGAILEPLVRLVEGENEAVQGIAAQLFKAMGALPRESVENLIAQLDQDDRRELRSKKVKLGPILIFLPELNKPAAVRLRGLLWALYNDKPLPAGVPNDGIVSLKIEDKNADSDFYRVIGYPIYGPRAIRIDMLDRVINAIYDSAQGGKFQAQHKMAEWLGSSIEDLYLVLEAMGHKKVFDPADVKEEEPKEEKQEEPAAEEKAVEEKPEEPKDKEEKAQEERPELATFRLKKGKAFEKRDEKPKAARQQKKPDKKPHKKAQKPKKEPRIMQAAAPKSKPEDSPFAILEQLKAKSDGP